LVVGGWFVLREKYCWLVADKPSEQAGNFWPEAIFALILGRDLTFFTLNLTTLIYSKNI
jgi:hypothetical protein